MPLRLGHAFVGGPLPQDFSGLLVDGQNLPLVRRAIVDRVGIAIATRAEGLLRVAGHSRRDEDPVTPDYGRRVGESRDFDAPGDVGSFGGVPFHRRFGAVPNARGRGTPELRPVP